VSGPDLTALGLQADYEGEDDEETQAGRALLVDATAYLLGFRWCRHVVGMWSGIMVPPVLGVALARIDPAEGADEWLWVIAGDLPPAYLDYTEQYTPNAACALDSYVGIMTEWIECIIGGTPVVDSFPVEAEPTQENALLLRRRLEFIDKHILVNFHDDLQG
jgi:hypothetical protein